MNATFGTHFHPGCVHLPMVLRRRPRLNFYVAPGQGRAFKRNETPSDLRRRKKRIGVKPAAIRQAEADSKAKAMGAGK